jgi:RNA polymerase sigma factor (TIGR02999 family)
VNELFPLVYQELRSYAARLIDAERAGHTLQGTALVHEAFVRLVKTGASYQSRLHFMNAAAMAMRRILVDHAMARRAQKRGGADHGRIRLAEATVLDPSSDHSNDELDILMLNDALDRLASRSSRQAQVVMLRFFAGREEADIAQMLQISESTVRRDWKTARLWLYRELQGA